MAQQSGPLGITDFHLDTLEKLTHSLSNTVGVAVNSLMLADVRHPDALRARLVVATRQARRAMATLQLLMCELRLLRNWVQDLNSRHGEQCEAADPAPRRPETG